MKKTMDYYVDFGDDTDVLDLPLKPPAPLPESVFSDKVEKIEESKERTQPYHFQTPLIVNLRLP